MVMGKATRNQVFDRECPIPKEIKVELVVHKCTSHTELLTNILQSVLMSLRKESFAFPLAAPRYKTKTDPSNPSWKHHGIIQSKKPSS